MNNLLIIVLHSYISS